MVPPSCVVFGDNHLITFSGCDIHVATMLDLIAANIGALVSEVFAEEK